MGTLLSMKAISDLVLVIKKNGVGIVAVAIIFMMVHSWFPRMESTLNTAVSQVSETMLAVTREQNTSIIEVTREFRQELKEHRVDAAQERALMWQLVNESNRRQREHDDEHQSDSAKPQE